MSELCTRIQPFLPMMTPSQVDVVPMLTNDDANRPGPNVKFMAQCSSAPEGSNEPCATIESGLASAHSFGETSSMSINPPKC